MPDVLVAFATCSMLVFGNADQSRRKGLRWASGASAFIEAQRERRAPKR